MESNKISKTLIRRLPLYLEHLKSLPGEDCNISATAIAEALGLGDVQVRKDLAKISGEGRRRTGRSRNQLIEAIEACMDSRTDTASILVGAEGLGKLLLDQKDFASCGVNVVACFDLNTPQKRTENGKVVYSIKRLESFCRHYEVRMGIIAVPSESAQSVCDGLIACGIRSIWNFSQAHLRVPTGIFLHEETANNGYTMGRSRESA